MKLTLSTGAPTDDDNNSLTVGPRGPILLQDMALIDKLAHFDRERIPERVVHAKGAGAHGYFEVTHDVTGLCKAKFLNKIGKRTPIFTRFSTVGGEKGSSDSDRDPRGFAVKFYTEEGIWDMVGNNTPVFFIRDPMKFPDFIHTQKRNPQTNLKDPDAFWDFLSLVPESLHQVTILFSDRGTPQGYRHMDGFSSHTLKMVNAQNQHHWVKLHFKTNQGIKNFQAPEAAQLTARDPDSATRDLFQAIARSEFPSWTVYMQVMSEEQAQKYHIHPFDVTKIWPHKDFPLKPFGKMVLNRNPTNYFAEVEQVAFSPGNMVPGIEPSPDRMLQGRLFSYPDTHRHRLGPNFMQIPINVSQHAPVTNYQRDGFMTVNGNQGSEPNYFPNSVHGTPRPEPSAAIHSLSFAGSVARHPPVLSQIDFDQPGDLYRLMSKDEKTRLVDNIVGHLKNAKPEIQKRQLAHFTRADADWGRRIGEGLSKSGYRL